MKRPLHVSEEADAEATEAARWYAARRPKLGDEFLAAIDEALNRIETHPDAGSRPPGISSDDIGRVIVHRFPYDVVYVTLPDRIQVLAVAHQRRRPGYWVGRLPR